MKVVALPESWSRRALVITDVDAPESWFTPGQIPDHRLEKRRIEWMRSRIAAIELSRLRGADVTNGDLLTREPARSFSHSGLFGGAAIDDEPVGIDIEVPRMINPRAAHLFLTEEEISVVQQCVKPAALLHFWCAKEAVWKKHGGTITTLKQVPLQLVAESDHGLIFEDVETFEGEVIAALTLRAERSPESRR